jgi:uncharacterized metal-binding protein YceD (DUF177 family)
MGNPLRDRCTAAELASVEQVIEIADKISSFESLERIIEADLAALDPDKMPLKWRESAVLGILEFGFADVDRRIPRVSGRATAVVAAVCQRCLEPFQLQLEVEPKLLLLGTDEAVDGFDEFEVWELDEPDMRPQDIVEELLIMAMPFSAMHDTIADCKAFELAELSAEANDEKVLRPFASLRMQMKQNEKDPDE